MNNNHTKPTPPQHLLEAIDVLSSIDMPKQQQTDLCGYVLLALSALKPNDKWAQVTNNWIRIHDIIVFGYVLSIG